MFLARRSSAIEPTHRKHTWLYGKMTFLIMGKQILILAKHWNWEVMSLPEMEENSDNVKTWVLVVLTFLSAVGRWGLECS